MIRGQNARSVAGAVVLAMAVTVASNALAQTSSQTKAAVSNAPEGADTPLLLPEGKTLPEGVLRTRIPYKSVSGSQGFAQDGSKVDSGFTLKAQATALVLEYGVSDRLSLQFVAPVVLQNSVTLDQAKFRDSAAYDSNNDRFLASMAALLASATPRICPNFDACLKLVESGLALPVDRDITLPTGEVLTLKAGVPLKTYADQAVVRAATPSDGQTGLGDLEVGALFAVLPKGPLTYSVGLGLRAPTGSFAEVPSSQRPTGRGTLDAGLRQNLDLAVGRHVMLSWQNQSEQMLVPGTKNKTSLVDNTKLNLADPTTPAARAAGSDGADNEQEFTREGVRNVGFLKAGVNLGLLTSSLKSLSTYGMFNYNYDAEERLDGKALGGKKMTQSATVGGSVSGLSYQIPASLDVDYEVPTAGENTAIAASVLSTTLKLYYKF